MFTPIDANCVPMPMVKSAHVGLQSLKVRGKGRPVWVASLLLALLALPAAQPFLYPASASTRLYFAQLADGGPAEQKWATTIIFVNPSATTAASVTVTF